jgi:hypothetical protein
VSPNISGCPLPRELACRSAEGIEVALLWIEATDDLIVTVIDDQAGVLLTLDVAGADPLDVFHHPFAYAAQRSIDYAPLMPTGGGDGM